MLRRLILIGTGYLAACGPPTDNAALATEAPPPAAAVSQITSATPLDEALRMVEEELAAVTEGPIDDDATDRLLRAEALSDRLLETRIPFEWLRANGYAVDSRVRQIQALADRVVAQIRSGAPADTILADVRTLHAHLSDLRAAIARGGTARPTPLDQLLSDFERTRRRPAPPPAAPPPPPPPPPPDTTG